MSLLKNIFCIFLFILLFQNCKEKPELKVTIQHLESPAKTLFQAISYVDENAVWVSGHKGMFMRSKDGGGTWDVFQHPTGDTLQFRDLYALSEDKVILMTSGEGSQSRIFSFAQDSIWKEHFVMNDASGFIDAMDFWDNQNGIVYGDAIDNYPYILLTKDGGESWQRADTTNMPKAGKGEGGFAASGTCLITRPKGKAWIATGAGGNCRVLSTQDYGKTWQTASSPLVKGDAAGNTSISMVGNKGFLVGGDLAKSKAYTKNVAFSEDEGKAWDLASTPVTKGAFYCGDLVNVGNEWFAFACGPKGLDYTQDFGKTWTQLDTLNYWAVGFYKNKGLAIGRDNKILRIVVE